MEKTKDTGGLALLPPASDTCQECATKHDPHHPHNRESLYYQMAFKIKHGRWPTWDDAMTHCSEDTKELWKKELKQHGVL